MEMLKNLAADLCGLEQADEILEALCQAVFDSLRVRLKEGVTPERCGKSFWIAAAYLAADAWKKGRGKEDVTAFSAGSIHMEMAQDGNMAVQTAMELLSPWLKDGNFAFVGVPS